MRLAAALAALTLLAAPAFVAGAAAQDFESYQQRQKDLTSLATLFGELHHLRRTCDPRYEADVWRERMKKLLELEEPQENEREALVGAFNKGYRAAQSRYPACTRKARDYAASRAVQGDTIVERLAAPLRDAGEVITTDPVVVVPATE
ncbi:MAG: TIGR02301 family protein [Parvularculaceae bacterium]